MTVRRFVSAAAGLLFGLLAVLVAPAAPASAHAALLRMSPAEDEIAPSLPAEVVLYFSEPVRIVSGKVQVIDPKGARVDRNTANVQGSELHIPLNPSDDLDGTYLVSYRVNSVDSHPVSGSRPFSVRTRTTPPAVNQAATGTDPTVATALAVAHGIGYAGLVLVIGSTVLLVRLWPRRLPRRGPVRLVYAGLGALIVGTGAEMCLQVPYSSGDRIFSWSEAALRDMLESRYGAAHVVRLGIIAACAVLLHPVVAGPGPDGGPRGGRADRVLLVLLAALGLATWPVSGHAGASSVPAVTAVADVVHLAAMSLWLGGLVVLVGFLLRQAKPKELTAILPVWSRWAAYAVGAIVLTGTVQALVQIGSWGALVGTTYGRLVLLKIALLGLVLVIAAFARRLVRGENPAAGAGRLRRTILAELAIAVVVLTATSALVQTTPARNAQSPAAAAQTGTGPYDAKLTSPHRLYSVEVQLEPPHVGTNELHVFAYTLAGATLQVVEWKATMALPEKGIEPFGVSLVPAGEPATHAFGQVQLDYPGTWELRVTLRTTEFDQDTVTLQIPIR